MLRTGDAVDVGFIGPFFLQVPARLFIAEENHETGDNEIREKQETEKWGEDDSGETDKYGMTKMKVLIAEKQLNRMGRRKGGWQRTVGSKSEQLRDHTIETPTSIVSYQVLACIPGTAGIFGILNASGSVVFVFVLLIMGPFCFQWDP